MLLLVAPMEALVVGTAPRTALGRAAAAPRMDTPPPPGKGSRLGGTVDQDGKSNVWAVEPSMKVEKTDKGLLQFAPIAAVAVAAVLSVPLLPILFASNPDQGARRRIPFFFFASRRAFPVAVRSRACLLRVACGSLSARCALRFYMSCFWHVLSGVRCERLLCCWCGLTARPHRCTHGRRTNG